MKVKIKIIGMKQSMKLFWESRTMKNKKLYYTIECDSVLDGYYLELSPDGYGDHPQFKRLQDAKNYIKQLAEDDIKTIKESLKESLKIKKSGCGIRY